MQQDDEIYMQQALQEAQVAHCQNEVPVGAVVVKDGEVIARGHNQCIQNSDPCAHAEILVLRQAAKALNNYRLEDCELFVSLEPCSMCAGAILNSRIKRVVFGAHDLKAGAAGSIIDLFANQQLNHQTKIKAGVLSHASINLLQAFFKEKRDQQKEHSNVNRLREDFLRLPTAIYTKWQSKHQLENISCFHQSFAQLEGARLHYLDTHAKQNLAVSDAIQSIVILPGLFESTCDYLNSFLFYKNQGFRVIVIDSFGMGFSDKAKHFSHNYALDLIEFESRYLLELFNFLNLSTIHMVASNWSLIIAIRLAQQVAIQSISLANHSNKKPAIKIKSWSHYLQLVDKNYDFVEQSNKKTPFLDKGHFHYSLELYHQIRRHEWLSEAIYITIQLRNDWINSFAHHQSQSLSQIANSKHIKDVDWNFSVEWLQDTVQDIFI